MIFERVIACARRPKPVIRFLRWSWVLFVFINEVGLYFWHISLCQWPTNGTDALASHIAIVADPQIVDHYSFDQAGILVRATQFLTDTYVRKSYLLLQSIRRPSTVIFLGDFMDGGRMRDDAAWLASYSRHQSIFRNRDPENRRVYDMAGNHDIGIGNTVDPQALSRFHRYVGPTNQVIDVGGYSVVLLDTLTLESDDPSVSDGSRQLVRWLEDERAGEASGVLPRLLFTHMPMWRPESTFCSSLRQNDLKYLRDKSGYQFRDQLSQNTTEYLLRAIEPAAVFSGDNHDICTTRHQITGSPSVPEYTIGAFGWTSSVPTASYGLLSLHNSGNGKKSFILQNCYLPHQIGIFKGYAVSLILSLLLLAYAFWCKWRNMQRYINEPEQSLLSTVSTGRLVNVWRDKKQRMALDVLLGTKNIAFVVVPTYVLCNILFYII
ncbi:hypothetical protein LPJ59_000638 [Coemansia sp. RSA 2399]|nr:hypothetical protein LPJ59_000638 [Coemansia sp. RSA 2399]KAJ1907813.1 hypothetical protein LPJ81_000515 [Coemansia sp. IMI 209127]